MRRRAGRRLAYCLERYGTSCISTDRLHDAAIAAPTHHLAQLEHGGAQLPEEHFSHGAVVRVVRQVERAASSEDARRGTHKRVGPAVTKQDVDRGRVTLQAGPVEWRHASAVCSIDVGPSLAQCTYNSHLTVTCSIMQSRALMVIHGVACHAPLQEELKLRPVLLASELYGRC